MPLSLDRALPELPATNLVSFHAQIPVWNSLPASVAEAPGLAALKRELSKQSAQLTTSLLHVIHIGLMKARASQSGFGLRDHHSSWIGLARDPKTIYCEVFLPLPSSLSSLLQASHNVMKWSTAEQLDI